MRGLGDATSRLIGFNVAARRSTSILKNLTRGVLRVGKRIGFLMKTATLATTVIGGLGVAATKSFADFQDAMTQSLAIMGDVSESMRKDMATSAELMGRTTRFSAQEAAESFFFLASAGFDAKQSLAALPAVADFAQAGMFDMARATELAGDSLKAMGLAAENPAQNLANLTRVTDVLVKANTLAQATVEQFGDALTNKLAARARSLNVSLEETVALLATMAERGLKGRRAGQQLNILMRDLARFAIENADAFRRFGLRVFDTEGNMRNFADIIEDVENRLAGLSEKERTAAIQMLDLTRRSNDVLVRMIGASDKIREFQSSLEDAGGFAKKVANNQLKSLTGQFELLQGTIGTFARRIGEAMSGRVLSFINNLRELFMTIDASGAAGFFTGFFDSLLSGLDTVLVGIGKIIDFIKGSPIPPEFGVITWALFGTRGVAVLTLLDLAGRKFDEFVKDLTSTDRSEFLKQSREDLEGMKESLQEAKERFSAAFPASQVKGLPQPFKDLVQGKTVGGALAFVKDSLKEVNSSLERNSEQSEDAAESAGKYESAARGTIGTLRGLLDVTDNFEAALFRSDVQRLRQMKRAGNEATIAMESFGKALTGVEENTPQPPMNFFPKNQVEHIRARTRAMRETAEVGATRIRSAIGEAFQAPSESEQSRVLGMDAASRMIQSFRVAPAIKQQAKRWAEMTREEFANFLSQQDLSAGQVQRMIEMWKNAKKDMGDKLGEVFKTVGRRIVDGIIQGGLDMKDILKSALVGLINFALFSSGGLFGSLGIFSPSRVTMEAGRQITKGLAVGIESETNRVQRAMRNVGAVVSSEAGRLSGPTAGRLARTRGRPVLTGAAGAIEESGIGGGRQRAADAIAGALEKIPEPKDPRQAMRDKDWKNFLRGSVEVLRNEGADI